MHRQSIAALAMRHACVRNPFIILIMLTVKVFGVAKGQSIKRGAFRITEGEADEVRRGEGWSQDQVHSHKVNVRCRPVLSVYVTNGV